MKHHCSAVARKQAFDMGQHLAHTSNTVDGQNFPALLRASFEHSFEHPLLGLKASIELGPGIKPHLSNVSTLLKEALQER
ncbi:hypothetical protein M062_14485 [Pseudomonas aeruginosa RP73]|nr:hypothetical protein M062_14485 [Pseudomonas aeruginosa RP73]KUI84280.1 hypothetical protein AS195_19145 [Pseudomonas aeruginosa]